MRIKQQNSATLAFGITLGTFAILQDQGWAAVTFDKFARLRGHCDDPVGDAGIMDEQIAHDIIISTRPDEHGHVIDNLDKHAVAKQNCWNAVSQFEL